MTPPASAPAVSLSGSHRSIALPVGGAGWRRLAAFMGPGFLVAVGYMDPGNWATDIAGGSAFGYTLLSVILLSNLMAIVLQALSVRLGVAAGLDLAQACRAYYSKPVSLVLWLLAEAVQGGEEGSCDLSVCLAACWGVRVRVRVSIFFDDFSHDSLVSSLACSILLL